MTGTAWLLFIFGSVFTISAMALFLYAMWLGLHHNRWWPMGIVATVWVVAMAAYSLWDGKERTQMQRQRIEELSSHVLTPAPPSRPATNTLKINT